MKTRVLQVIKGEIHIIDKGKIRIKNNFSLFKSDTWCLCMTSVLHVSRHSYLV